MCPECIDINLIGNAKVGSKVKTGSGREYIFKSRKGYNNDQREEVRLLGEDGQKYHIMNIPAFMSDVYKSGAYYVITTVNGGKTLVTYFEGITLKISADTKFSDGEHTDGTFGEYVKSGIFKTFPFESCYSNYTFDIHFAKNGKIDIFTGAEVGSNGRWYYGEEVKTIKTALH